MSSPDRHAFSGYRPPPCDFFSERPFPPPPETGNPRAEAPGIFPLPANGQGAAEAAAARSGSRENWVLCEICRILPKIGNHDTATAIHTVQITLGQGLGRSMGALRSLLPRLRTLGRHGLRPRFRRPAFRGRRHLARRRVHRHPLPLERRGLPLRRASGRLAPPAGTEHGFKSPRGLLPRAARHSGNRPASISTSGWVSSPIPTRTSTPRSGGRSIPTGWC